MARKNIDLNFVLREKEVEVISDDDDDDDDDDYDDADDAEETLRKYSKPVAVYKIFAERSKNRPYFLRRCLKYIIKAKKNKESNSGETIIFNYMDSRKNILKYEGVKNCSCPFCLMLCGDQWGLRDHLESSHDVFEFEFWRAEEDHGPEIDVNLKYDENSCGEREVNHNKIPYYFCSRRRRKRIQRDRSQRKGGNKMKRLNVRFLDLDLNELPSDTEGYESTHWNDIHVSSPPKAHPPEETSVIPTIIPPLPVIAESSEPLPAIAHSIEPLPPIAVFTEPLLTIAESTEPRPTIAESSEPVQAIVESSEPLPAIAESSEPLPEPLPAIAESAEPLPVIVESTEPLAAIAESTEQLPAIAQSTEPLPARAQSSKTKRKVPRASKRKKLLAKRLEAKRYLGLNGRQFYHSQTKQPMTYEEVMSNNDSENEEDYSADIYERLRLLQIVDASKEEKRFMYLWNILIRKRRVIANKHVPLACEEFTKLHKQELLSSKSLSSTSFFWWWKLFKMKLWKHGLICANTIDRCNTILENSDETGLSTSHGMNSDEAEPSTFHGIILRNSDEVGPSTSHGTILRNSDEVGPSISHGTILRNSDEVGPSISHGTILRNSDEVGPCTSHGTILRNSDKVGPSTSHGTILRNSDEAEPSISHGIILRNSNEAGPSTSHGIILRNSDEAGSSTSHDIILRNSDEAGPSISHGIILQNSDKAGPSTFHSIILQNSDETGPSTSHGTANPNTEQWMEVD